jgi:hypothetical protein
MPGEPGNSLEGGKLVLQLLWQLGDFLFQDLVTFHKEDGKKWKLPPFAVSVKAAEELLDIVARKLMAEQKKFSGAFGP